MEAMRKLLLGGVAAAALSTAVGAAETTPVFEPLPPAEATPYNWMGLYGRTNKLAPASDPLLLQGAPIGGTADSFLGGTQVGINYQNGPWVFGVEGDVRRRGVDFIGANGLDLSNFRNEQGWIGTLRPRAGVAADNWLFYGTGGIAHSTGDDTRFTTGAQPRTGWTVGGGVEYAPAKQWSLGLEYLYADFGKSGQSRSSFSTPGSPNDDHSQILRGRLNYRFGWDGLQK
jgi:outer membrane immunogenic protein